MLPPPPDYSAVFGALTGVGATVAAFSGGIYVQRLVSLRSDLDGALAQRADARAVVLSAEEELAALQGATFFRFRQLASGDERFLNELFAQVRDEHTSPTSNGPAERQQRLALVLQPVGTSPKDWPEREDEMGELWEFADHAYSEGVRVAPDHNDVVDPAPWEFLRHTLALREPTPEWLVDPSGARDHIARAQVHQLWAENLGEAGVFTRLGSELPVMERQERIARFRDELKLTHLGAARLPNGAAEERLAEKRRTLASIRTPVLPGHLWWEGGVFLFMLLTLVVVPLLFVIPSSDPLRVVGYGHLAGVAVAFFAGLLAYVVYLLLSSAFLRKGAADGQSP